jgi:protein-S-isoprenylcysteine O-methyltransferase Ste14
MTERSDHAPVLIAPPAIFGAYLLMALLLQWAIPMPVPWLRIIRGAAAVLILAGLCLGAYAVTLMMRAHTSPDPHRPTTALVTHGPYGRTRNPIYLGFFLIYLGFTLFAGTAWGVLLSPLLLATVNRAVIQAEERYLQAKFDSQYLEYKARVRQWL